VSLKLSKLETWCKDDLTTYHHKYMQRVNFFTQNSTVRHARDD
jgi:hypothetical protein